jgi:glycosyltransferase involved in cell wall biosynthesis
MTPANPSGGVSVIVPFYRAEPFIGACLDGLLAQEAMPDPIEFLMVDNNSGDRSAEIVAAVDDPRVRLLVETTQGAYAARNRALREARGDMVVFTDPDCVPEPRWIQELLAPMADDSVGIVMGRVLPGNATPALRWLSEYETTREAHVLGSGEADLYFGRTNNMAVRRSVLDAIGPFVERMRGSDTLFVQNAVRKFTTGVLAYRESARVRHLEIRSLTDYLKKVAVYGRSSRQSRIQLEVIDRDTQRRLVDETCRNAGYGPGVRLALLGILGLEGLSWRYGRWQG